MSLFSLFIYWYFNYVLNPKLVCFLPQKAKGHPSHQDLWVHNLISLFSVVLILDFSWFCFSALLFILDVLIYVLEDCILVTFVLLWQNTQHKYLLRGQIHFGSLFHLAHPIHGRMKQFTVVGVGSTSSSDYRDSGISKNMTGTRLQPSKVHASQPTSVS